MARRLTRRQLRILCYHGFSLGDEAHFRPGLFIDMAVFRRRLSYLQRRGYPIVKLDGALDSLSQGTLPPGATVITIDDGFYGTYSEAVPVLQQMGFPATLYLTTYYCVHNHPIFRLTVQYMFWKTEAQCLELAGLGVASTATVPLRRDEQQQRVMDEIIDFGENACTESQRCELARELGTRLSVDYDRLAQTRMLSLVSAKEAQELASGGVDLQLHTHRHRFPTAREPALREIADNREVLEPIAGQLLNHFCYPSGIWSERQWPWLTEAGIRSAVTCDAGLNDGTTPPLALRRFLDSNDVGFIDFEAEMTGFKELCRALVAALKRRMRYRTHEESTEEDCHDHDGNSRRLPQSTATSSAPRPGR
jgi:peptidoglycan/xylan/chitin deacetylase (PgdA/CDA1 family)